jgi:anti-sigma regulatory factor (Ser/Thr protein kinase)
MSDQAFDQATSLNSHLLPIEESFPAVAGSVSVIRWRCLKIAEAAGVSRATLADIALTVSEAVSNAVLHAYPPGEAGSVVLRVKKDSDQRLEISIADTGVGLGNAQSRGGAGQGMLLMDQLADQWRVTSQSPGTLVTLSFRIG